MTRPIKIYFTSLSTKATAGKDWIELGSTKLDPLGSQTENRIEFIF